MDDRLIRVALGKAPADMVIKGGKLVNVMTHEVYEADVAVANGRIATVGELPEAAIGADTRVVDAKGLYVAPGFMDAHIHVESSMLSYTEFAKLAVRHGTTAVATDLMEVTIVSGVDGMKEVLEESRGTPVRLFYPVPAFMEESDIQTTGSTLHASMIDDLIKLPEAVGLAEVLVPPILAESPASAHMLALAKEYRKTAEGHAPAAMGGALDAIVGAGVTSDHESTNKEEALAKLRAGLHVLMREGSASTDLRPCLRAITEGHVDTRYCSMVSDDIDALHIRNKGHLDDKVRIAVREGVDPVTAIQMVTINPAENFRVQDKVGSVTPGRFADIVLLSSLEECRVEGVIANGEEVVRDGKLCREFPAPNYSDRLRDTIRLARPVTADDMVLKVKPESKKALVHVIGASHDTLFTEALEAELDVVDGAVQPDVSRDILRIACVERYGKNGSIGRSFIKNFGLREGAIAISVGHDHHNITAVGADAADMAFAVNRVAELEGGLVLVKDGKVLCEIPLPICGLLSDLDGETVADRLEEMIAILKTLGCEVPSPNITLSFITLIFIPCFGITDRGLFDVREFRIIDPVIREE